MSQLPGDRIIYRSKRKPSSGRTPSLQSGGDLLMAEREQSIGSRILRYFGIVALLGVATAILWPFREAMGLLNMGMHFLVLVIGATVFGGQKEGLLASVLGFLLFDFFLIPPYLTFVVTDFRNILALFVFLGVSLLISWLLSTAREQARQAERRANDISRLYELSQAIIGAQRIDEVLPAIAEKVHQVFEAQECWILLPDKSQQLVVSAQAPPSARPPRRDEMSLASWAFWNGSETGHTGKVSSRNGDSEHETEDQGNKRTAFIPLRAARRTIGVLAVADKKDNRPFTSAERTVLATFAGQAAVALDRLSLLKEAQRAELLSRTDELKSALMSAVSHDLKTPLASIMASVTSLLEPGMNWDEETERDFLQGIYDEALRLNKLVGNLLDMSRIEGGALHPEKEWYSIAEVVESVVQRLEPRLAQHPLTKDIDKGIPLMLFDFSEIDQVLTNLVENAAKYTPAGAAIHIAARCIDNYLELSVEDRGAGVPAEHLKYLFDKFYRVDKRSESPGTGLGLAITRGFVEAHGGHIRATNRQGGGLKVTFTLPIVTSQVKVADATGHATAESRL